MTRWFLIPALLTATVAVAAEVRPVLVIHGGAGTIQRSSLTPEMEKAYRDTLALALKTGYAKLLAGATSVDAVEATVRVMEDSPLFNAAKGAVFTHDGRNELDASIMDGRTRQAGAVGAVTIIRNPISAARAVMEKSEHVLLIGRGAELFATEQGLEIVDPSYFWTERRWKQLQDALVKEKSSSATAAPVVRPTEIKSDLLATNEKKFGTVGAVALDVHGNLAAATSTGGMTNKRYGRVGDSPIIGAGNYADNETCAVSGTGHGEFFIRYVVGHEIAARMRYAGESVQTAATAVVEQLRSVKGEGGVIALDRKGNFAMPFNSEGMYRGYINRDGEPHVFIYGDDK